MSYIILKSKTKKYHKKQIDVGFRVLVKYKPQLLKFCASQPYLPMTPEEVYSDLIVDRIVRFIEGCKNTTLDQMQDLLKYDLDAVRDPVKLRYNMMVLKKRLDFHMADPQRSAANGRKLKRQILNIRKRKKLLQQEKRFLGYLCSCVRRTKINFLQQKVKSKEGLLTQTSDPTNGLKSYSKPETESETETDVRIEEMEKGLKSLGLSDLEIQVLIDVAVYDRNFESVGRRLGVSISTASRYYQLTMRKVFERKNQIKELFQER